MSVVQEGIWTLRTVIDVLQRDGTLAAYHPQLFRLCDALAEACATKYRIFFMDIRASALYRCNGLNKDWDRCGVLVVVFG
jgi:hypothetical protein